jgi:hypothetical protein
MLKLELMSDKMIDHLKSLASSETREETILQDQAYFSAGEIWGSNMDDAYFGGMNDGDIQLARDILSDMGIKWWS